jgi:hypothetical protein
MFTGIPTSMPGAVAVPDAVAVQEAEPPALPALPALPPWPLPPLAPVFELAELELLVEQPPPPPVDDAVLLPLPADTVPLGPNVTGVQPTPC